MSDGPQKVIAADGHEYHKSATANAAVAPTNQNTLDNATGLKGLSADEGELVTLIDYHWGLTGSVDKEFICEQYGYSSGEYDKLLSPAVIQNLHGRGIPPHIANPSLLSESKSKRVELTPLQLVAANLMLDLADTRSLRKKLQDIGVTTKQYQGWLRDEKFKNYLRDRAEALVGDVSHEAMLSLVDQVQSGNLKAIQYYHEVTGRFVPQSSSNTGTGSTHDLQNMVIRIVEIIVEEVDDPNVAARISDRLKGLVTGAQLAGVLPAPVETVVPEIATARPMTPEIQAMMDKGVGFNE